MTYFTEEYLDGLYDEGYKARVEHGATVCPYEDRAMAEAWWDGYDRATEDDYNGFDPYAEADFAWVHNL
jgi:ribosome modulation factor